MDPVTHALVGAAAARTLIARPLGARAWLPGAAGALLPDVDALIRSSTDPLLYAEFHRHFTHALAFIPIGGALAALPWIVARPRGDAVRYLAAAVAGYATHGVLDACTTYGTLLFWPFSDRRVAWNVISIVDPLFTGVLLAGVAIAVIRRRVLPAAIALAVAALYLGVGAVQHARAADAQARLIALRSHDSPRAAVFPAFATTIVWRSLYQQGDMLYMDRIRVPWFGGRQSSEGYAMRLATARELPPPVAADARLRRDFDRFAWFAGGWIAQTGDAAVIGDARYSSSASQFDPVWGIRFRPGEPVPIEWIDRSARRRVDPGELWNELRGTAPGYQSLDECPAPTTRSVPAPTASAPTSPSARSPSGTFPTRARRC